MSGKEEVFGKGSPFSKKGSPFLEKGSPFSKRVRLFRKGFAFSGALLEPFSPAQKE